MEDSLAQINFCNQQADAQTDALNAARRVTELTKARSDAGVLTAFEVEDAERSELQQERQAAELSGRRFAASRPSAAAGIRSNEAGELATGATNRLALAVRP